MRLICIYIKSVIFFTTSLLINKEKQSLNKDLDRGHGVWDKTFHLQTNMFSVCVCVFALCKCMGMCTVFVCTSVYNYQSVFPFILFSLFLASFLCAISKCILMVHNTHTAYRQTDRQTDTQKKQLRRAALWGYPSVLSIVKLFLLPRFLPLQGWSKGHHYGVLFL